MGNEGMRSPVALKTAWATAGATPINAIPQPF